MSGIAGVVRLDGKPVEPAEIGSVAGHMERRGPDGTQVWTDGPQALAQTLLATTPEALHERLPFFHGETGCTITADARLDNRAELIERLGSADGGRVIGDGELILLAYLKWGADCPQHLSGDFAFAIWDPRDRSLFGARDLVGMRQLIYHHQPGQLFAFATEAQALLRHPDIPHRINEARIADFLEDLEAHDLESTFFDGLLRLPPAHAFQLGKSGLRIWRHTELEFPHELKLSSDRDYAEAFREVFTGAVRSRLRSAKPVGSMLSGGMDSGSVAAVAASILQHQGAPPLDTFSAMGPDPDCVETRTIEAAMTVDHLEPHRIELAEIDEYRAELEAAIRASAEPFDAHMTLVTAVYLAAQRAGVNVMLDGVGGDTTLESGNMIVWHLRRGNFIQAWREARGEERFYKSDISTWRPFARGIAQAFAPSSLRQARHAAYVNRVTQQAEADSLLDPDFAARIDIARRRLDNAAHIARPRPGDNADRRSRVLHPYVVVARERYDRVAGSLGVEPRDPFLDRRVIEFALSLPPDQLQKDGWPKMILRKAMDGLMPDAVRWRTGKEHLGWDFTTALWQQAPGISAIPQIPEWIDAARMGTDRQDESGFADSLQLLHLSFWLDSQGRESTEHSPRAEIDREY